MTEGGNFRDDFLEVLPAGIDGADGKPVAARAASKPPPPKAVYVFRDADECRGAHPVVVWFVGVQISLLDSS